MKKQIVVGLSVLMLLGLVGCKKSASPKAIESGNIMDEIAQIAIDNEDDCEKAKEKMTAFFNSHRDVWGNYIKDKAKAMAGNHKGTMDMLQMFMTPPSEDLAKKLDNCKCNKNEELYEAFKPMMSYIVLQMNEVIPLDSEGAMLLDLAKETEEGKQENDKEEKEPEKAAPIAPADLAGRWTIEKESDDILQAVYTLKEDGTCLYKDMTDTDHRKCTFKVLSPDAAGGKLNQLIVDIEGDEISPGTMIFNNIRLEGDTLWFVDDSTELKFVKTKLEDIEFTPYEKKPDERIPTPVGDDKKPAKYVEFVAPNEAATETKYVYKDVGKSFISNYEKQLKKAGFNNNRPKGADPQYIKKIGKDLELTVEINKFDSGEVFIKMWANKFDS